MGRNLAGFSKQKNERMTRAVRKRGDWQSSKLSLPNRGRSGETTKKMAEGSKVADLSVEENGIKKKDLNGKKASGRADMGDDSP